MDNLGLLIGIGAGGYYIWTEYQKTLDDTTKGSDDPLQTDITKGGVAIFSQSISNASISHITRDPCKSQ